MKPKSILITGGAGFIGSHVIRTFVNKYSNYHIFNLDCLTYAGNLANIEDLKKADNYTFCQVDINDAAAVNALFEAHDFMGVIHLAAESHVDRSILDPTAFVRTNVLGTVNLLEAARKYWHSDYQNRRFYHVSTDEVFGSLHDPGTFFTETTAYDPQSPYSASKAASDHFVRAYQNTYKMNVVISNCSNNYGPNQFPEKLIPLMIQNIVSNKPLPVYGKGENVRDWLYVEDHARAIDLIFHEGKNGETYNVGGFNEWKNIDIVMLLCGLMDRKLGRKAGESAQRISYVTDRPGHDLRYAIDAKKIMEQLGWQPSLQFEQGLEKTVDWYLDNSIWLEQIKTGAYQKISV